MMRPSSIATVVALTVLSCARPDPDCLATFDGGQVRRAEFDVYLASLPVAGRPDGAEMSGARVEQLEELVLRRLLAMLAERSGGEGASFRERQAAYRRQATAMAYVRQRQSESFGVTEQDLRERFAENPQRHVAPERREVFQVFRRARPGEDPQEPIQFAEEVRSRLQSGESIASIAAEEGESQSRHSEGRLGWIERDQLPSRLEKILFDLPEGVPSEAITTEDGVHVFLVGTVLPGQTATFEQVGVEILKELQRERQLQLIEGLIDGRVPAGSFVPTREEFMTLVREGDGRALALRVGNFAFSLQDLTERVESEGEPANPEKVWEVLEFVRQRELVYLRASEQGLALPPPVEAQLDEIAYNEMVAHALEQLLQARVAEREGELRAFFDARRMRYTLPLRLVVERLVIPVGPDSRHAMAVLEARREQLDTGEWTLAAAAEELGGVVRREVRITPSQLRAQVPLAAKLAVDLEKGQHSFPFRQGKEIMVLHLLDRIEPQLLKFEEARDRVASDYLADHGERVVLEVKEELFEQFDVEIFGAGAL